MGVGSGGQGAVPPPLDFHMVYPIKRKIVLAPLINRVCFL